MVFSRGGHLRQPVSLLDTFRYSVPALLAYYSRLWRVHQREDFEGVEREFGSLPRAESAPDSVQFRTVGLHHVVYHLNTPGALDSVDLNSGS